MSYMLLFAFFFILLSLYLLMNLLSICIDLYRIIYSLISTSFMSVFSNLLSPSLTHPPSHKAISYIHLIYHSIIIALLSSLYLLAKYHSFNQSMKFNYFFHFLLFIIVFKTLGIFI